MEKQLEPTPSSTANILTETIETFKAIILSPSEFFQNMPLDGGLQKPVVFLLIASVVSSLGILVISQQPLQAVQELGVRLVTSFVSAAYLFLICRGVGGQGTFEGTFRAFVYASAPAIFSWVPLVNVLAVIYTLFLLKTGLEKAHDLSPQRSMTAVGIWLVTLIVLIVIVTMATTAAVFKPKESGIPGI